MRRTQQQSTMFLGIAAVILFFAVGCGSGADTSTPPNAGQGASATDVGEAADPDDHDHEAAADGGHNLHGWWCTEHGVPEDECARCDISLIAQFKQQGDWCEEHDRPESQCFVCDATRFEKFAARYEAKTGKRPPAPTE